MSSFLSLQALRDLTRKRADVEGYGKLRRHPDTDVNGYVNRGIKAWYQAINRTPGRYVSSYPITTVANQTLYPLPQSQGPTYPDFWRLVNVCGLIAGRQEWLTPFLESERPYLSDPQGTWYGSPTRYALDGTNIELLPIPNANVVVTVRYIPAAPVLTSDTDANDFINGEEDYVIDYAARLIAAKDEQWELVQHLESDLSAQLARIADEAPKRDMSMPGRITDLSFAGRANWHRRRTI